MVGPHDYMTEQHDYMTEQHDYGKDGPQGEQEGQPDTYRENDTYHESDTYQCFRSDGPDRHVPCDPHPGMWWWAGSVITAEAIELGLLTPEQEKRLEYMRIRERERMIGTEAAEQAAVFEWAAWAQKKYPPLRYMHHIPNGGRRDAVTGAMLKRQGVKAGIPDIFLPYASGGWHGLYIEMKAGKNRPTQAQAEFLAYASAQKYMTSVCYSAQEAIEVIRGYLTPGKEMTSHGKED